MVATNKLGNKVCIQTLALSHMKLGILLINVHHTGVHFIFLDPSIHLRYSCSVIDTLTHMVLFHSNQTCLF